MRADVRKIKHAFFKKCLNGVVNHQTRGLWLPGSWKHLAQNLLKTGMEGKPEGAASGAARKRPLWHREAKGAMVGARMGRAALGDSTYGLGWFEVVTFTGNTIPVRLPRQGKHVPHDRTM